MTGYVTITQKLRMALARYENADRECPARKAHLGDKPCPKCRSGPRDGCGLEIGGAYAFVDEVRAICEQAEQPPAQWRQPSIEERPY